MKRKTLSLTAVFFLFFFFDFACILFLFFFLVKRSWCTSGNVLYNTKKKPFISYIYHLFGIFTRIVRMELDKIKYSKKYIIFTLQGFLVFWVRIHVYKMTTELGPEDRCAQQYYNYYGFKHPININIFFGYFSELK